MLPFSWLSWYILPLLDVLGEQLHLHMQRVGREAKSGRVSSSTMLGGGNVVGQRVRALGISQMRVVVSSRLSGSRAGLLLAHLRGWLKLSSYKVGGV